MTHETEPDGSAGDANYGAIGGNYATYRQPDPHIAAQISTALGSATLVLNVGAGGGSYEPRDRTVTAVEPSASMRRQRPSHLATAVDAKAESLPFPDRYFDASMATFTIHQWAGFASGLSEMRRVTKGPVVILTCDPALVRDFWLDLYAADVLAAEARRYPTFKQIASILGGSLNITPIAIPLNCQDGFNEAYYGRPECLLDEAARLACSAWSFVTPELEAAYVHHLCNDLQNGAWDQKFRTLRTQPFYNGSLRLLVAT